MSFNLIKEIAEKQDADALKQLLCNVKNSERPSFFSSIFSFSSASIALISHPISIDICKQGSDITAAEELAREGKCDAVTFLYQHGACRRHILRGFAYAGNQPKVEEYTYIEQECAEDENLEAEERREDNNIDRYIAEGYALGGHVELTKPFRRYISTIAAAFAFRGDTILAEQCLVNRNGARASVVALAHGYARGRNFDKAFECVNKELQSIFAVAQGLGETGDTKLVNDLMRKSITRGDTSESILGLRDIDGHGICDYAARGYALGGYLRHARELESSYGANPQFILEGLALRGRTEEVVAYCTDHNFKPSLIAQKFAQGGPSYITVAESYIKLGAVPNDIEVGLREGGYDFEADKYAAKLNANNNNHPPRLG